MYSCHSKELYVFSPVVFQIYVHYTHSIWGQKELLYGAQTFKLFLRKRTEFTPKTWVALKNLYLQRHPALPTERAVKPREGEARSCLD